MILQGVVLWLMPTSLGRRSSAWQSGAAAAGAITLVYAGAAVAFSGLAGRSVEPPGTTAIFSVWLFGLPLLIVAALFTKDAVGRRAGLRGGFVVWMLVLATPYLQLSGVDQILGGPSPDTPTWAEAAVVPFLIAAAIALKPWSAQARPRTDPVVTRVLR
jgi:hypothetical protein